MSDNRNYKLFSVLAVLGCGAREPAASLDARVDNGEPDEGRRLAALTVACGSIDFDELFRVINDDLSGQSPNDRANSRYLTLFNRVNAVGCGPELDGERNALIKLINSLSTRPAVKAPVDVDGRGLVYRIDLGDYGWDSPIEVNGRDFDDAWEAIAAHNPYAVPFVGADADDAAADTGTALPFMFADSLLAAAAVDELYYALIGIDVNQTLDDFILNELQIDIGANFRDEELVRAGFSGATLGLPDHSFLAERHGIGVRDGYIWQISDFGGGPLGAFQEPLGQPDGDRELVFTLANGLLGFALARHDGELLNDSGLLRDFSQANSRHRIAVSAFAKFASGVEVTDQVRAYALEHARELGLSRDDVDTLLHIYLQAAPLAARLDADREQFPAAALADLGLDIDDPEPISAAFATFSADLDLSAAAGDLLVSSEELEDDLDLLDPAVQALASGELEREDWTLHYLGSLCTFTVVLDNTPDSNLCEAALANER